MSQFALGVGACVLVAGMSAATLAARAWPVPSYGRHREAGLSYRRTLDEAALQALLTGGYVEANDFALCPDEQRVTFHALRTDGSRRCWTCSATTPAGEAS